MVVRLRLISISPFLKKIKIIIKRLSRMIPLFVNKLQIRKFCNNHNNNSINYKEAMGRILILEQQVP